MRKVVILLNICIVISVVGCGQATDFDLAKLELPTKKEDLKFNLISSFETHHYIIDDTRDKEAMRFDNLSLSGMLNGDMQPFLLENYVSFYEDKSSKMIDAYDISVYTTNETLKLEKLLEKKFGKADFHYKKPDFCFRIWESEDKAYFFEVNYSGVFNGESYIEGGLYVVNRSNEMLYKHALSGGFQYYANYLSEKDKEEHKGQPYSYRDFVIQQEKEAEAWGGESYYSEGYVK